jgi:two-component system, OmpR family, sensor histidine kinase KdpD
MVHTRRDPEQRPSPEALLEAARREDSRAGRLKIFVGAAPGVGKTYEMLQSAHAKLKTGADVVVGIVETHGRAETEALLIGLGCCRADGFPTRNKRSRRWTSMR